MRIGTNHGSLSDRIMSRYGDNPVGMVESALEFLQICEDEKFYNIVISMKSSNPQIMVQAYRLLVNSLNARGFKPYPLHLGVTEAGEAEDGRIKSAVGIGTLLEDGLGDTVRVSLTEDPEFEIPVAKSLVSRYNNRANHKPIKEIERIIINPYQYNKRETIEVNNIGGTNVPRVIADFSKVKNIKVEDLKSIGHFYFELTDKWNMSDTGADYIYTGKNKVSFMLPNGLKEIVDFDIWKDISDKKHIFPLLDSDQYENVEEIETLHFIKVNYKAFKTSFYEKLKKDNQAVLIIDTNNEHAMAALRRLFYFLIENEIKTPVIISRKFENLPTSDLQLYAATDMGGLLIDGLGDGVMLSTEKLDDNLFENTDYKSQNNILTTYNNLCFGILQAARTRISKTEYISCPSCGRTLFDLQETTAMIRKRTDHLKGLKIGIMGCIVNGPGEMADADFGYVGVGKDRIALYKGKEVVKKAVPAENALDELINLIKSEGKWIDA
jgi:(E)-4-hydroxy-3-methylbut-2-enyl-diphosphate synthase